MKIIREIPIWQCVGTVSHIHKEFRHKTASSNRTALDVKTGEAYLPPAQPRHALLPTFIYLISGNDATWLCAQELG